MESCSLKTGGLSKLLKTGGTHTKWVLVNISLVLHRLETLESLDRLKELEEHDDLKSKLLFSVIVVRR